MQENLNQKLNRKKKPRKNSNADIVFLKSVKKNPKENKLKTKNNILLPT